MALELTSRKARNPAACPAIDGFPHQKAFKQKFGCFFYFYQMGAYCRFDSKLFLIYKSLSDI